VQNDIPGETDPGHEESAQNLKKKDKKGLSSSLARHHGGVWRKDVEPVVKRRSGGKSLCLRLLGRKGELKMKDVTDSGRRVARETTKRW